MSSKTILVVDDEQNIRDVIKAYLEKEGYYALIAKDGHEAINIFNREKVDLIILDLMMPGMTGHEVCQRIRVKSNVPIIMLTAQVEENDVILGIKIGADDYIKKPFSVRELMVRVSAIFRRIDVNKPLLDVYTYKDGDLIIDFNSIMIKKKGKEIILTPNEFRILKTLIQNVEIVLSRNQIIEKTFGINFDGFDRTIDTHIKNLRQKIEDDPKHPKYIKTVYSMGYKFYAD